MGDGAGGGATGSPPAGEYGCVVETVRAGVAGLDCQACIELDVERLDRDDLTERPRGEDDE